MLWFWRLDLSSSLWPCPTSSHQISCTVSCTAAGGTCWGNTCSRRRPTLSALKQPSPPRCWRSHSPVVSPQDFTSFVDYGFAGKFWICMSSYRPIVFCCKAFFYVLFLLQTRSYVKLLTEESRRVLFICHISNTINDTSTCLKYP